MWNDVLWALLLLFVSLPGVTAAGTTDYNTLEILCIFILVLFFVWIIVIIILIFCCKKYIEKMSQAPCNEDEKPGPSGNSSNQGNGNQGYSNQGNANQGYRSDEYRPDQNVTVITSYDDNHGGSVYQRPKVREQYTQTDPSCLMALGPNRATQTDPPSPTQGSQGPHRLVPISS